MAHKNLSTEVTAEARHRRTQLPDISKYYMGSFETTGIPKNEVRRKESMIGGKLSSERPRVTGK